MPEFDLNKAGEQRSFDVIPDGTITVVQMNIRPGNAGEDGLLKRSSNGLAEGLDVEFIVADGEYAKRRFWWFAVLSGTTDGHAEAARITLAKLRAILESARGIKPADISEAAKKARVVEYADFDGLRFMCRIGVEPARDGYKAKNNIAEVITPDRHEWHAIEQTRKPPGVKTNVTPIAKPAWAQ
jgi:hypothetical protein